MDTSAGWRRRGPACRGRSTPHRPGRRRTSRHRATRGCRGAPTARVTRPPALRQPVPASGRQPGSSARSRRLPHGAPRARDRRRSGPPPRSRRSTSTAVRGRCRRSDAGVRPISWIGRAPVPDRVGDVDRHGVQLEEAGIEQRRRVHRSIVREAAQTRPSVGSGRRRARPSPVGPHRAVGAAPAGAVGSA